MWGVDFDVKVCTRGLVVWQLEVSRPKKRGKNVDSSVKSWLSAHNTRLADTTNWFSECSFPRATLLCSISTRQRLQTELFGSLVLDGIRAIYNAWCLIREEINSFFFLCWKNSKCELIRPSSLSVRVSTMMMMMMIVEARVKVFFLNNMFNVPGRLGSWARPHD